MSPTKYVPHREPMLLIGDVHHICDDRAIAEVNINQETAFAFDSGVPAWLGIEYIAQTAAVYSGYQSSKRGKVEIAFLLGARNYRSYISEFKFGSKLIVEVWPVLLSSSISSFKGKITCDGELLAETDMSAYQPSPEDLVKLRESE